MAKKCFKCGITYEEEALFCGECGGTLETVETTGEKMGKFMASAKQKGGDAARMAGLVIGNSASKLGQKTDEWINKINNSIYRCDNCGAFVREDAKFCDICGNKIIKQPKENTCKLCGATLRKGAKFCNECGANIEKQLLEESQLADIVCQYCGSAVPHDARFCNECGKSIEVKTKIVLECRKCGAILKDDARFCNVCGMPVKQGDESNTTLNKNLCVNCGSVLTKGSAFCPVCGTSVGKENGLTEETILDKRICMICKEEVDASALFCPNCGTPVQKEDPTKESLQDLSTKEVAICGTDEELSSIRVCIDNNQAICEMPDNEVQEEFEEINVDNDDNINDEVDRINLDDDTQTYNVTQNEAEDSSDDIKKDIKCVNCGESLIEGAMFCPYCGQKVLSSVEDDDIQNSIEISRTENLIKERKRTCASCGWELSIDAAFCSECGMSVDKINVDDPKKVSAESIRSFICHNCGSNFEDGAIFCGECGAKIDYSDFVEIESSIETYCENCGTVLEEDAIFCSECGNKVR